MYPLNQNTPYFSDYKISVEVTTYEYLHQLMRVDLCIFTVTSQHKVPFSLEVSRNRNYINKGNGYASEPNGPTCI
jgi:hypothetical protein